MNKQCELRKNFGELLKKIRTSRKLTQSRLAELVNVEPKHISCIENGLSFPSAELLSRLSKVFNIQTYELFMFENKPSIDDMKKHIEKIIKNANDEDLEKIYLYASFVTAK